MKILVAIDGSEHALRALSFAIDLVARLKTPVELILANAHDDVALRSAGQWVGKEAVDGYLADLSQAELRDAVAAARAAGVRFGTRALRGPVAQTLVDAAREADCGMIVLGSKGRTALKDLLIGSVAQRVASLADVPVTLVK
jgi:nucleotide-binding universal stress UspA family protein